MLMVWLTTWNYIFESSLDYFPKYWFGYIFYQSKFSIFKFKPSKASPDAKEALKSF